MSTLPNSRQYDDFLVLFTDNPKRDRRSSLFLSSLKHSANTARTARNASTYAPGDLDLDNWDAKTARYFRATQRYGLGDNDVHIEWVFFLVNLILKRATKTKDTLNQPVIGGPVSTKGDEVLQAIKNLSDYTPGSMKELIVLLLQQKFLVSVTKGLPGAGAPGEDLTPQAGRWNEATDFLFKDNNQMIAANIIGNNALATTNNPAAILTTGVQLANLLQFLQRPDINENNVRYDDIDVIKTLLHISHNGVRPEKFVSWNAFTTGAADPGNLPLNGGVGVNPFTFNDSNHTQFTGTTTDASWQRIVANVNDMLLEMDPAQHGGAFAAITSAHLQANPHFQPEYNRQHHAIGILNSFYQKIRSNLEATEFGYQFDKFFVNTFLTKAVKNAKLNVSSIIRDFSSTTDQIFQDKYYRSLNGTLMERKKDGSVISVDEGSDTHQALKEADKCYTTGVRENGNLTCKDYIVSCVSGGDISSCKTYLADHSFWQNASKEVEDMIPMMAYNTLKSFEFGTIPEFSKSANRIIKKIQTWSEWLESLKNNSKLTGVELGQISINVKLQEYLNALVFKVNSNPAIINDDYKLEKQTDLSEIFKNNKLAKMGLLPNLFPSAVSTASMTSIIKLSNTMVDSNNRMRISLNSIPGLSFNLTGGASRAQNHLINTTQQQHHLILSTFENLKARLKNHKKDIAADDETDIRLMIKELKQRELKLNELIVITEKYTELLEIYGEQDSHSALTLNHLDEFVKHRNNYFEKVSRKQVNLMSIIKSIAEKVNELSNKNQQQQTQKATPLP